jgi:hypothetical protein
MQKIKIAVLVICMLYCTGISFAQFPMKTIDELKKPGNETWLRIQLMAERAKNKVEILKPDSSQASLALLQSQMNTGTNLGSIIYYSGGILIDGGWLRILGSGSNKLPRSMPEWNAGKISAMRNADAFFLLVADDVMGGLFAIKSSSIDELETIGQVFYFGPNGLSWQPTGLSYGGFISYCFNGNLKEFYEDFRWKGWQDEVSRIDCNSVISCYPLLWTREGLQMKANRKQLNIQAQWNLYQGKSKTGSKKNAVAQRQPTKGQSATVVSMWTQEFMK